MATISVCMIVKNEEKLLWRCLAPLVEVADEIIIVDTGSDDNTKTIAKQFTGKVYDYEWTDDFADARNFSLEKARCEYIYVADADEVLDEENLARFKTLKEALLPAIEVVEMAYEHVNGDTTSNFAVEYRPKLFARQRNFQFMDPVHEVLRSEPVVFRSDIVVKHMPEGEHGGRDLAHFARLVAAGKPLSARLKMMYARELMMTGEAEDFAAAAPFFEELYAMARPGGDEARQAACVLAKRAAAENDAPALLRFAAAAPPGTPPAEVCCALGAYFLEQDDLQRAADWYGAALAAGPELVLAAAGPEALLGLAKCYEKDGDLTQADALRRQAEEWDVEALNPDG